MNVQEQIDEYIASQAQSKRESLQILHKMMLRISPDCKLWYLDGRNAEGKIISNPNIGYGVQAKRYADGETREFYRIGISANTTGISVYVMGIDDKKYLSKAYGQRLGKATVTGYCVKFRNLGDVNLDVIEEMVANHMGGASARGS
ncbi:MAG TPA: hypothetical protein VHZ26_06220 [Caulobacteraceae bacterium]|jgi:hypothetical protein|nr:hypothetical protein [Caulobacteraceae bacterium]